MGKLIQIERIERKIFLLRGQKVILDRDLAELYRVSTRDLNKAVSRNIRRFPEDFMFQLDKREFANLMFHFGTSKRGGTRKSPRVFTEQGVAMLSSVLRSRRAINVNIVIMRAFVKLRDMLSANKQLQRKLAELERKYEKHDVEIKYVFEAIRKLMSVETKPGKKIGFLKSNE